MIPSLSSQNGPRACILGLDIAGHIHSGSSRNSLLAPPLILLPSPRKTRCRGRWTPNSQTNSAGSSMSQTRKSACWPTDKRADAVGHAERLGRRAGRADQRLLEA